MTLEETPHYVYRLYDDAGALLYVGMTRDPRSRRLAHKNTQPWWQEVATWRLTIYPNRAHARRVESLVIWAESPLHNVVGRNRVVLASFVNPFIVQGLNTFDAEYAAEYGSPPSQIMRRREALRLLDGGAA